VPGWREFCSTGGGALTDSKDFSGRFSGRVESYRQFRPRYPDAVAALLETECGLTPDSTIADIAAGTGLLAELFLARGFKVVAVEPNQEMRAACETLAGRYRRLRCVDGAAEATGLPSHTFDLITVAQALHWFDLSRARAEFSRILRPGGWCAVIYNERRLGGDVFHDGYERLLRAFGIDYEIVQGQHLTPERISGFFAPYEMRRSIFPNVQSLTLEALEGRIVSSSYMPRPGHARYAAMQAAIADLFEAYQDSGCVRLEYECAVSYGRLGA
jgi:SAM-dependent methyltransferase